jgi:hypothetical protein
MNAKMKRIARIVVAPVIAAGIAGGVLLGAAGPASAAESQSGPAVTATPWTVAHPATNAEPGSWWHRHHPSLLTPSAATNFTTPGV